ncbi:D-alanyl-D-alanine carboxypeptidase family protein [Apilactobacillus xinyiensis]|uniref:D-alanyl-D-alanine carboxypeptidase family protein n=1 Tax=Apilactobacillus xinyiensis TaxID=2841032 RepID=UPI001C7DAED4|nr:D-alanyl-D-alanine carboxypeptidase family protein [Apilactobacillus xinyiensis]
MNNKKSIIIAFCVFFCFIFGISTITLANSKNVSNADLGLNVKSAIAVDPKTHQVLYSKNINETLPIASITKLLTVYMVLNEIHSHKLNWNDKVSISKDLQSFSLDNTYANVPLVSGHTYTIKQLYEAALVYSANGAALALGNKISNNDPNKLVKMMYFEAKKMGIRNAKFYNACGLKNGEVGSMGIKTASYDSENVMSAKDLAILASHLINQYPEVLNITKQKSINFNGKKLSNWDLMLNGESQAIPGIKVDGLKTGTSNAGGANFVGTGVNQGHRIVTVVMHAKNDYTYDPARFIETSKLMQYVFNNYDFYNFKRGQSADSLKSVLHNDNNFADYVNVPNGKSMIMPLLFSENYDIWVPKNNKISGTQLNIASNVKYKNGVNAPIKKFQPLARMNLNNISFLNSDNSQPIMMAANSDDKANVFVRMWREITSWF